MRSMVNKSRGGLPLPALGLRLNQLFKRRPRHQLVHAGEEDGFAGDFAVGVKSTN
jgi:hypothetical protein